MAAQITAVIIFLVMFAFIITEKIPRHIATTLCSVATLILVFGVCMHSSTALFETLNFQSFTSVDFWRAGAEATESTKGINWQTIIFIFGMMIMVKGMAISGFFSWLCLTIAKAVRYNTTKIFVMFMVLAFVLSMFIDSITVILFLAAITITQGKLLKFDPIPVIIAEIFCSNLGGSSTMCGDPPNIIIGTALHYTFTDFLFNTGVIAILSLVLMIFFFYLCFRKKLNTNNLSKEDIAKMPSPDSAITSKRSFIISCIIFLCAVVLLVTHGQTELTVSTIGIIAAIATCATAGKKAKHILRRIDYPTLIFFIGLFVVVGGLEETGILELIANFIHRISGGNVTFIIIIIIWVSAIASAFIDNIPFAATDHQKPCNGIRSRFIRSGMDTGTGHRYRWKCYPDRCICQRSWYRRCIKKRSSYFLETVLYLRDSGNTDRNCSINAIYHFQIYIIQNSELISDAKSGSALQTYTYLDFC